MSFDLRAPLGALFLALGVLIGGFGWLRPAQAVSLGVNVDLVWGAALLAAGAVLAALALSARRRVGTDA